MKNKKQWLTEAEHYEKLAVEAHQTAKPMPPEYYEQRAKRAREMIELIRRNGLRKIPRIHDVKIDSEN